MRILHFSDLHIGVENYGRPATEGDLAALPEWFAPGEKREHYLGHSTRLLDFLATFDELIAYALTNDVDLVLFSGDAYKSREPTQTHQREFAKRVARLGHAGVPVFLLVGNHDLPHAAYKATAVEIFDVLQVPNVTVSDQLKVYDVQTRKGPLQVLALPWIRRSTFLARDDVRNLPMSVITDILQQRLTDALTERSERLDPTVPAVISAHVSLNTAKLGSERTMMMGYDHTLLQSSLTALPVDYIALGHIHRAQVLSDNPMTVYPGSLQRVDFGEENDESKGFYVIDLEPGKKVRNRLKAARFHAVSARRFVTVAATITETELDPTAAVLRAIGRKELRDAIVRVHINLPSALAGAIREPDIRRVLDEAGAHTVAAINREVEREARTRLGAVQVAGKSPMQLLKYYLETQKVAPERAQQLLERARRLMSEDEREKGTP